MDLLRIPTDQRVTLKKVEQKQQHDVQVRERVFIPKICMVMARNFSAGPKWLPGIILKCCGPMSYIVELQDGRKWRRHVEHLVRRGKPQQEKEEKATAEKVWVVSPQDSVKKSTQEDHHAEDLPETENKETQEAEVEVKADETCSSRSIATKALPKKKLSST